MIFDDFYVIRSVELVNEISWIIKTCSHHFQEVGVKDGSKVSQNYVKLTMSTS